MAQVDNKELKKNGFMPQVDKERYSMRIRIAGGQIKAEQLKKVYEIAASYGQGYVHMTSRQSIEIPFIKLEDIEKVKAELAEAGLQPAAGGARVRTVTACQGCKICPRGLIDSRDLAAEIDEKYHGRATNHKFKIGITGCRNNCLKAEENDLGIKGAMKPEWVESKCTYCGACEKICPAKALKVDKQEKKLSYNEEECIKCGKCVKACAFKAWEGKSGFRVYFGGNFGNQITVGRELLPILYTTDELHKAIETTIEFFTKNGKSGERLSKTLDRVGWEQLQKELLEALG